MVEPVERKAWRDSGVAANLASFGAAGLVLASAGLVLPLGWFGVVVTSVALALGLASCALAILMVRSRAGSGSNSVTVATPSGQSR